MELKLIKIDSDIRNKVEEEIKEDKVHSAKEANINKDSKDNKAGDYKKLKKIDSVEKKYIVVDGIKNTGINLSVDVERFENINQENSKGRLLDTKK